MDCMKHWFRGGRFILIQAIGSDVLVGDAPGILKKDALRLLFIPGVLVCCDCFSNEAPPRIGMSVHSFNVGLLDCHLKVFPLCSTDVLHNLVKYQIHVSRVILIKKCAMNKYHYKLCHNK